MAEELRRSRTFAQPLKVFVDKACELLERLKCPRYVSIFVVKYPSTISTINTPPSVVVAAAQHLSEFVVVLHCAYSVAEEL